MQGANITVLVERGAGASAWFQMSYVEAGAKVVNTATLYCFFSKSLDTAFNLLAIFPNTSSIFWAFSFVGVTFTKLPRDCFLWVNA